MSTNHDTAQHPDWCPGQHDQAALDSFAGYVSEHLASVTVADVLAAADHLTVPLRVMVDTLTR